MRVENAAQAALERLQAMTSRMTERLEATTQAVNALADEIAPTTTQAEATPSRPTTATTTGEAMSETATSIPSRESSGTPSLEDHPGDRVDALDQARRPDDPLEDHDAAHARNGRTTAAIPIPRTARTRKRR